MSQPQWEEDKLVSIEDSSCGDRVSLLQQIEEMRSDLAVVPELEAEVLHQADLADELQRENSVLQASNQRLSVMAHARGHARAHMEAMGRVMCVIASQEVSRAHIAFSQWRAFAASFGAVGVTGATTGFAGASHRRLAQLEYDALLLKRVLRQQATAARHTTAAQLVRAWWHSSGVLRLAFTWSRWHRFASEGSFTRWRDGAIMDGPSLLSRLDGELDAWSPRQSHG